MSRCGRAPESACTTCARTSARTARTFGARDSGPITFSGELRSKLREAQERDEPCRALMQQQRGA
eukprot:14348741-Alexandrium_andersonii.AAC.1